MKKYGFKRKIAITLALSMVVNLSGGPIFGGEPGGFSGISFLSMADETITAATPGNAQSPNDSSSEAEGGQNLGNTSQLPDGNADNPDEDFGTSDDNIGDADSNTYPDKASPSDALTPDLKNITDLQFSIGTELWLTVEPGTPFEQIDFPETLLATVIYDKAETQEEVPVDFWKCNRNYNPNIADVYDFIPTLSEEYRIKSDVTLPLLYVCTDNQLITHLDLPEGIEPDMWIMPGTVIEDLMLPETLNAVICGTESTTIPVTWNCEKGFQPEEPGSYLFTSELKEGYKVSAGVVMPEIMVTVNGIMPLTDMVKPSVTVSTKPSFPYRNSISLDVTVRATLNPPVTGKVGYVTVTIHNEDGTILDSQDADVSLNKSVRVMFNDPVKFVPNSNETGNKVYYMDVDFTPTPGSSVPINASSAEQKQFRIDPATLKLRDPSKFTASGVYEMPLRDVVISKAEVIIENTSIIVEGQWKWDYNESYLANTFPPAGKKERYNAKFFLAPSSQPYEKYYKELNMPLTPEIAKKQLWFVDVPQLDDLEKKVYDGTKSGALKANHLKIRKTKEGKPEIMEGPNIISTVEYTDKNAGNEKRQQ